MAQIARSLARALSLEEDLAEALALAHDLGHGPFGHTGEDALAAVMAPWGGFDHNVQSLRIVVELERRYLDFDGLNLTSATLHGIALRKGAISAPGPVLDAYARALPLRLDRQPGLEAQVAARADDIAYNAHDLEDALRAGLFTIDEAMQVPVVAELEARLRQGRGPLDPERVPFALARGLIDLFVTDVLEETGRRLAAAAPQDAGALERLDHPVVVSSAAMNLADHDLKAFLFERMYRNPAITPVRERAYGLVKGLAGALLDEPALLPEPWRSRAAAPSSSGAGRAQAVSDYVAGLTDRDAEREHRRLFDAPEDLL